MRDQYITRRGGQYVGNAATWGRNRNTVRYSSNSLGFFSTTAIMGLLVILIGLVYVAQSTKATSYDYQLDAIDSQISDLTAEKEDLAVESARLTSVAAAENSDVAKNMDDGAVAGYAQE